MFSGAGSSDDPVGGDGRSSRSSDHASVNTLREGTSDGGKDPRRHAVPEDPAPDDDLSDHVRLSRNSADAGTAFGGRRTSVSHESFDGHEPFPV